MRGISSFRDAVTRNSRERASTPIGKRRWPRRIAIVGFVLIALFYVGGGWYFSGQIRSGGLEPREPERNFNVTVERIDGDLIVLSGDDESIDDPGQYALYWEGGFGLVGEVISITPPGVERKYVGTTGSPRSSLGAPLRGRSG